MKHHLIIILSIFIFSGCKSQNVNDKSKRNENWVWWVDANTKKGEWIPISNKDAVKDGRYIFFYSNGNIFKQGKLINGENVDTIYKYNIQGNISSYDFIGPTTNYRKLITNKEDTLYYYILTDGIYKSYNADGTISDEGYSKNHAYYGPLTNYLNGEKHTVRNFIPDSSWQIDYYENGRIKDSSFDFDNNGLFLICKSWYENGQLATEVEWNKGVQDGITKDYYEEDQQKESLIKSIGHWKNGVSDGITIGYYENGRISDSLNFMNGQREGVDKHWFESGRLQIVSVYENGNIFRQKVYGEDGVLISDTTLPKIMIQ